VASAFGIDGPSTPLRSLGVVALAADLSLGAPLGARRCAFGARESQLP